MKGPIGVGSKYLEEKWRKQEHEEHLRRVREAKSDFNQHTMVKPYSFNQKTRQQKRQADQ
jgi:hypothetical protein